MQSVFLVFIYALFPVLCYFLYLICSKMKSNKENHLFLDLTLITCVYLIGKYTNNPYLLLSLINMPIIIAIKENRVVNVFLVVVASIFISKILMFSMFFIAIFYYLFLIVSFFVKNKKILIHSILTLIFVIICNYYLSLNLNNMLLIISWIILYILSCNLIKSSDYLVKLTTTYKDYDKILKEKAMYKSLFKITHEIKNPLTVCKGYLSMLPKKSEVKKEKYIKIIKEEIERTILLLEDFSNFSKMNLKIKKENINALLKEVCNEMVFLYGGKVKISFSIEEKETYLSVDKNRIKQVLLNAIKNSKESILKSGYIKISSKLTSNEYEIIIMDNGEGMDKEALKKVGTAFYTTKKDGTGLGVCLSKEIIESHGGKMKYKSKKNQGTTLIITLPLISTKSI